MKPPTFETLIAGVITMTLTLGLLALVFRELPTPDWLTTAYGGSLAWTFRSAAADTNGHIRAAKENAHG